MPYSEYLLLLNSALKNHLLSLDGREKNRLKEKLDFLANGLWDSGVRIKKLKGLSRKVVFEARLTRSRRLLFTLGRSEGKAAVYAWGIVDHDDVNRKAAHIFPDNAPFLSFVPETEDSYPDICIDDLADDYYTQENIEEKALDDYGPQKWFVLNDDEWKRLLLSGSEDHIETFLYLSREQASILKSEPPILISGTAGSGKTTLAVYYLLKNNFTQTKRLFLTYSPFLKRFSERIYDGLVKNSPIEPQTQESTHKGTGGVPERPDFLTFPELLEKILESRNRTYRKSDGLVDFQRIYRNHSLSKKYDAELVWEEIRSIIKGAKPMISLRRCRKLVTAFFQREISRADIAELRDYLLGLKAFEFMPKIETTLEKKTGFSDYDDFVIKLEEAADPASSHREDAVFLLQAILKTIEKRTSRFTSPLLTFQEYCLLGKKRAPNFLYDREDIYSIAEYYQEKLEEQELHDEIDLCRKALEVLNPPDERYLYDLVVCDEVQDFADIQISLIFRLVRYFQHVVLAGDTKQIINPSGFRWEEVKDKFFERGLAVPEIHNLNLNFRCVGSIVRMSNALLDLKQRLVGLTGSEIREDWKYNGKPPCLIHNLPEEEVLNSIRLTGAGRIVLTRSEREQKVLKKMLGTELVFTIYEAKGLEFDTVLLWKFCLDRKASEIWRRISSDYAFDQSHYPHIRHELSLLYVAITRTRNTLMIYDGEKSSDIWRLDMLSDCLYMTGEREALTSLWERVSTPEEWKAQGDYFFEREYFPAALECYRNAGDRNLAERAEAFVLREKAQFEKAAVLLEKHGYVEDAAVSFERCGSYEKAFTLWQNLGNRKQSQLCKIRLYEKQKRFDRAAEEWEKLGEAENALENWKKAGNHGKIAEYYFASRQYEKASEHFGQAGNYERAAACYKKVKKLDRAAELFFRGGHWESAASIYKKLKNTGKLLECYHKIGDDYSAGRLYEREKDIEKAIESYRSCVSSSQAGRQILEAEAAKCENGRKLARAAVRYSALSLFGKSAALFERAKKFNWAVLDYRREEDYVKAAECLAKEGNHYEAALEMEKVPEADRLDWIEEELSWHIFPQKKHWFYRDQYDKRRADALYSEASRMIEKEAYDSALVRYKVLHYPEGILNAYRHLKRDDDAIEYFLENSMAEYAGEYIEARGDGLDVSRGLLERIILTQPTRGIWHEGERESHKVLIQLLRDSLKKRWDEAKPLAERFLDSINFFSDFAGNAPEGLLDLVMETRSYNTVFNMVTAAHLLLDHLEEAELKFFERVKQEGESSEDPNLLVCYYYLFDTENYEKYLGRVSMDRWNYELFTRSRSHYRDAVDFLLEEKNTVKDAVDRAARTCRINDDYPWAARIYEQNGDLKSAAKHYRDAKMLEEAMRCYKALGDEPNIARIYERMGKLDKAEKIWTKMGRRRDVARVQKKILRKEQELDQRTLF